MGRSGKMMESPPVKNPRSKRIRVYWSAALALLMVPLSAVGGEAKPAPKPEPKAAHVEYRPGKVLCRLENRRVKESSGVAASQVNPGVFWTHNDSGDLPRLYAFDKNGKDLGIFRVKGAHVDWEDICSFRVGKKGYLLIADTGDNLRRRKSCNLYLYAEPKLIAGAKKLPEVKLLETLSFTYKGGVSHDVESIAVDPTDRTVYLATRSRWLATCHIFTLPGYKPGSGAKLPERPVAQPAGLLKLRNVTAMDISPDGRRAVIQTYLGGHQFLRRAKRTWKQAFAEKPRPVGLPWRAQGEGLCYGADGRTLYLTSEGQRGCPLIEIPAKKPEKK